MVIGPNDGDEKVAHCVVEPCGPEQQKRLKGGELWWTQFQNQHCYKDSEHAIGERAQSLRGCSMEHGRTISCALAANALRNRPREQSRNTNAFCNAFVQSVSGFRWRGTFWVI